MALPPKESGKFIAESAEHVKIKQEGIESLGNLLAEEINSGRLCLNNFGQNQFHPTAEKSWTLDWIFVVDTLNYCFWHFENDKGWVVDGKTGYFALCCAINGALKEDIDILNPAYYSKITEEQALHIFRSDNEIKMPLIKDRIRSLHEAGTCLLEKYDGKFENVVKAANNSAVALMNLVVQNFECYRDESLYKGKTVALYKRTQILVGDIWACFKNEGIGYFKDIDEITMFADYRVPQSLIYLNVMEYSKTLNDVLSLDVVLKNGDEMEVEIRGCSIHAVTLLCNYIKEKVNADKTVNAILVDHFLWDYRRSHAQEILKKKIPFHKVECVYY